MLCSVELKVVILTKIYFIPSGFATFKNTEEGQVELGGLELGGELLDTADGEMKKSEELLGKRGEGGKWTLHDFTWQV